MEIAETTSINPALITRPVVATGPPFSYARRRLFNAFIFVVADAAALIGSILLATTITAGGVPVESFPKWGWFLLGLWFPGTMLFRVLPDWGLGPVESLRRYTLLMMLVYGSTTMTVFIYRDLPNDFAPLLLAFAFSLGAVPFLRIKLKRFMVHRRWWGVPTVVYGGGPSTTQILKLLTREQGLGYQAVGLFTDDADNGARECGVDVLGGTHLVHNAAPVAVLVMPSFGRTRATEMLEGPLARYRKVIVIPDMVELPSLWVNPRDLQGMLGLEIRCNLCSPFAGFVKRSFDVAAVVLTAPLWVPLCLLLALLIWAEDRHHPLFLQERVGAGGRRFKTWKFRTMAPNAEAILEKALEEDEALREEWTTTFKLKKDPRITRAGKMLRRYSLDELPQLVNVLRGDMSLVGPRPLPTYHYHSLPRRVQTLRARVRPGITGLWQVSGRSDAGTEGMLLWDPYYVRNWSLWLDTVILIRTTRIVVNGAGAY